jgi:MFS family permease
LSSCECIIQTTHVSNTSVSVENPSKESEARKRRRHYIRVVGASALSTSIEWYDFLLYGVAAATVFPRKFFPASDPFIATLLSFSTFFVGFAARPVGAAIFGHYGDRLGRRKLFIVTVMMTGLSTTAIGLVPSYQTIGIWGAILLTVGRMVQGTSLGGAWAGSVLIAGEWSDPKRRGFATSFAQAGGPFGMVLANGALGFMTLVTSEQQFLDWGWRVPFVSTIVLVLVSLYIQLGIMETPVFVHHQARGTIVPAPVMEVVKRKWREIMWTMFLRTGQQVQFYIFTTYIIAYATTHLAFSRQTILNFVMIETLISAATVVLFGRLSDTFGRRRLIALGCILMLGFPFLYFAMLDTGSRVLAFLAIAFALPLQDLQYGPQAAFISESFPGSLRYSGAGLGYQLASITSGGPAPILAAILLHQFGTPQAIALYMSACSAVSLASVCMLPDRSGTLDHM